MSKRETRINQAMARASMEDSAAMKAISIMTMTFLPATAIAISNYGYPLDTLRVLTNHNLGHIQHVSVHLFGREYQRRCRVSSILGILDHYYSPHLDFIRIVVCLAKHDWTLWVAAVRITVILVAIISVVVVST